MNRRTLSVMENIFMMRLLMLVRHQKNRHSYWLYELKRRMVSACCVHSSQLLRRFPFRRFCSSCEIRTHPICRTSLRGFLTLRLFGPLKLSIVDRGIRWGRGDAPLEIEDLNRKISMDVVGKPNYTIVGVVLSGMWKICERPHEAVRELLQVRNSIKHLLEVLVKLVSACVVDR